MFGDHYPQFVSSFLSLGKNFKRKNVFISSVGIVNAFNTEVGPHLSETMSYMDNNRSLRGILYCTVYICSYITERTGRPLYLPGSMYSVSLLEYSFYLTSTEMKRDYQVQSKRNSRTLYCIYNKFVFVLSFFEGCSQFFKLRLMDIYKK